MINISNQQIQGNEIQKNRGQCTFDHCTKENKCVCVDCLSDQNNQDECLKFNNYIKYQSHEEIQTAQISGDEFFLGIGGWNQQIKIIQLKNKKLVKSLKLDGRSEIIKFTNDSRYLLCGDSIGQLYCFDLQQNFKVIYKYQIHSECINEIILISNDQVLTQSDDNSLIITDIKQNLQLFQILDAHDAFVWRVEYDKQQDVVISCSYDGVIQFFSRKDGKLKFQQNIKNLGWDQLQLIQDSSNLISSHKVIIILWEIDYQRSQLIKLKTYDHNQNYNFTSILNNRKIVVIIDKQVQILDNNLVLTQSTNHDIKDLWAYFQTRQLNSLNYIVVPGRKNLQVLKRV